MLTIELWRAHTPHALHPSCSGVPLQYESVDDLYLRIVLSCVYEQIRKHMACLRLLCIDRHAQQNRVFATLMGLTKRFEA